MVRVEGTTQYGMRELIQMGLGMLESSDGGVIAKPEGSSIPTEILLSEPGLLVLDPSFVPLPSPSAAGRELSAERERSSRTPKLGLGLHRVSPRMFKF